MGTGKIVLGVHLAVGSGTEINAALAADEPVVFRAIVEVGKHLVGQRFLLVSGASTVSICASRCR